MVAILESARGHAVETLNALRKAIELDPKNVRAIYMLAEETERQGDEASTNEVQNLLNKILEIQPDNHAVQLERRWILSPLRPADAGRIEGDDPERAGQVGDL